MTFGLYSHDPVLGIDHVGCSAPGLPNGASCDPYKGDTLCRTKLAVLCTDIDGSLRPGYAVTAGNEFYEGWAEGHYTTTLPRSITALGTAANVDALCAADFGPGWRWAEFHDGQYIPGMDATDLCNTLGCITPWPNANTPQPGGWSQYGYGNVGFVTPLQRYWVHINSTTANCVTN
jgi:hypothetical protein